jgi:hypothetical protein
MMTPTDKALDDVAACMKRTALAVYPAAPRSFGRREVPTFKAHTEAAIIAHAPCVFDPTKIDPKHQYDVFVADPSNALVSGWNNISTEECAEWAFTLQNMIRKERPWLRVKVWSKPRCHA